MEITTYPNNNTNKLKYVAYVRKSTEEEDRQAMSIDAQVKSIKKQFPDLDITFIVDNSGKIGESMSAAKPGRPLFDKMITDLINNRYQGVIAWHPDRLSRNTVDASMIVWNIEQETIKDLKFCNFTFENTPEGIMMLQMIMSQSQYFSSKLSKDIRRGNLAKRQNGEISGMPPCGYIKDPETHQVIRDPVRFPILRRCWDLLLTGDYSIVKITHLANKEWGLTTVPRKNSGGRPMTHSGMYKIFSNIAYAGLIPETHDAEVFYEAKHEPMITKKEFNKAQKILGSRGHPQVAYNSKQFVLKGLLRCGECGCAITAEEKHKKLKNGGINTYRYYRCTRRRPCNQRGCVREEVLFEQAEKLLNQYELSPELVKWGRRALKELSEEEISGRDNVQAMQRNSIQSVQKQLDRLLDIATQGMINAEEYEIKSKELRERLKTLSQEQTATSERVQNWYEIVGTTLDRLENANSEFVDGDLMTKRHILLALGLNPVLTEGKISVEHFKWLRPLKNIKENLTAQLDKVRTAPQQRKKDSEESLIQSWCWR
jgi:Site-specific recombinases, DNA invertase Pin homologs